LLLTIGCDDDTDESAAFLNRVRDAENGRAYLGMKRLTFRSGDRTRVFHYFVRHYPSTGDSAGPTVMASGRQTTRPERVRTEWRSRHSSWLRHPDLLLRNYTVRMKDRTTVVGRPARIYEVVSRHEESSRPWVRLAVDEETDLVLRFESFDWTGGEPTVLAEFTTIDVDPGPMPDRPERRPGLDMWGFPPPDPKAGPALSFAPMEPRWLPEGFERTSGPARFGWRRDQIRTVYSDGLAWFSIHQKKVPEGREERVVRCGQKGSRVSMNMVHQGVEFRVFGSVDPREIQRMLGSLGPVP
jgi:hypothetical protein